MSHVMLNGASIKTLVREIEATGVAEHVRVYAEVKACLDSCTGDHLANSAGGDMSTSVTHKDIWTGRGR